MRAGLSSVRFLSGPSVVSVAVAPVGVENLSDQANGDEASTRTSNHVKRRGLVPRQQMRVAGQREGGRVVAEGAAELEEVGAAPQMQGVEGVAERVEAGPRRFCLPHERLEDARPQVGRVQRTA